MTILPLVEGQGEVAAVPVLLRRLRDLAGVFEIEIHRPFRRKRSELVTEGPLRAIVRRAASQPGVDGILVILDSDDDCPKEIAPAIQAWAQDSSSPTPCVVVRANREYESWFLAALDSLRGVRGVREDAVAHPRPETPRDAKGELKERMAPDQTYHAPADQAALTARVDLAAVHTRSRSFRHLVTAFSSLVGAMGAALPEWPPAHWLEGEA